MCARYSLTRPGLIEITEELDAESTPEDAGLYRVRYNVAPTNQAWIIEGGSDRRVVVPATWDYRVSDGRPLINVRGEQIAARQGFRQAFASKRCAVITDGFYEWPGKGQAPFWFHRPDGGLVLLAGLFQSATPSAYARFAVLTTTPNALIKPIHDRMPVLLSREHLANWLGAEPAEAARLLGPAPAAALVATPVSKHVNNVRNDDPACVLGATHDRAPVQGSLFFS